MHWYQKKSEINKILGPLDAKSWGRKWYVRTLSHISPLRDQFIMGGRKKITSAPIPSRGSNLMGFMNYKNLCFNAPSFSCTYIYGCRKIRPQKFWHHIFLTYISYDSTYIWRKNEIFMSFDSIKFNLVSVHRKFNLWQIGLNLQQSLLTIG